METNVLPSYDQSDNPTGCCPRFKPEGWDGQELHFRDKLFVRAGTRSLFHVPLNMGRVFSKTFRAIEGAHAVRADQFIVLTRELSAWSEEHYFAVTREVPGQEMARLSGDYLTKVFEGPYREAPKWEKQLEDAARARGLKPKRSYFFYTTCPKCARFYGKNHVVGVAEVGH
jgi:hypothetical protein